MPSEPSPAVILIVDDTPANLRLLSSMLNEQGYKVRPAPNGQLALRSAMAAAPDLILLDINMPGMNGYDVCRQLKENDTTRQVPIIFISALNDIGDKMQAFSQGGVDYITKPFQLEEVMARVHTHLTLRNLQKQLEEANSELAIINLDLEQRVQERTAQLVHLNRSYERFLPREFLGYLNKSSVLDVQLGDQVQQTMTVMFSDIRGFTPLAENIGPQNSFNFLNEYLQLVSPVIRDFHGFVDKYLGDGLMALFPETADNALQAAIAIHHGATTFNQQNNGRYPPIRIGVGLHTGSLMLGIIGEDQRLQGTVIADAVNLAARLEGLSAIFGVNILISDQTLTHLTHPERYQSRFLGSAMVKGKTEPVDVYEIFDADAPQLQILKQQTKSIFEAGVQCYLQGNPEDADRHFSAVLDQNPEDSAARLYHENSVSHLLQRPDLPAHY